MTDTEKPITAYVAIITAVAAVVVFAIGTLATMLRPGGPNWIGAAVISWVAIGLLAVAAVLAKFAALLTELDNTRRNQR